jgi:Fur family peroxide stress response transcriptional regulator
VFDLFTTLTYASFNVITNTKMESLQNSIKSKGLRLSHPRLRIVQALSERTDHPTARQLFEVLAEEIPSLSKTTVYNTLSVLIAKGLVSPVKAPEGNMRYEFAKDEHCHFFCARCKRIIDTEFVCNHSHVLELHGHKVHSLQGCFEGICKECLGMIKQSESDGP